MSSYRLGLFKKKLLKKAPKNLAIPARNACVGVSFYKRLKAWSIIKKRHEHNSFPVNIAKFLRLPVLGKICEWLLFDCFNGLLLHVPKVQGLDYVTAPVFRVRVTGLVFCFLKSASLTVNWGPTCDQKPKTNTFDESIKLLHWLFLVVLNGFRSL